MDENNKLVEKLKTNENGYAISSDLEIGRYYLKEVKTDPKYILDSNKIIVDIEDNKTIKLNLENKKIKGKIKIIKTTGEDSKILNIRKGDRLSEVKFEIYDSNQNYMETLTTDEKGEAVSKDLEIGRYIVKEVRKKNRIYNE